MGEKIKGLARWLRPATAASLLLLVSLVTIQNLKYNNQSSNLQLPAVQQHPKVLQPRTRFDVLAFLNSTADFAILGKQDFTASPPQVFVLSAHKSGTTSLSEALSMLNYSTFPEEPYYNHHQKDCNVSALSDVRNNDIIRFPAHPSAYEFSEYMRYISSSENSGSKVAYEDSPWNHGDCYKQLQTNFPDALFILNIREPKSWIGSFRQWTTETKKGVFAIPGYQCMLRALYGKFDTDPQSNYVTGLDEEGWIDSRLHREQNIIDFFTDNHKEMFHHKQLPFYSACHDFQPSRPFKNVSETTTLLVIRQLSWRPFAEIGMAVPNIQFPRKNAQGG